MLEYNKAHLYSCKQFLVYRIIKTVARAFNCLGSRSHRYSKNVA